MQNGLFYAGSIQLLDKSERSIVPKLTNQFIESDIPYSLRWHSERNRPDQHDQAEHPAGRYTDNVAENWCLQESTSPIGDSRALFVLMAVFCYHAVS